MVKVRMGIPSTDMTRDDEIDAAIAYGDAYADAMIESEGGTGSVANPPNTLKQGAADFAAYYMHRIKNPTVASLYLESGKTFLLAYLRKNVSTASTLLSRREGIWEE